MSSWSWSAAIMPPISWSCSPACRVPAGQAGRMCPSWAGRAGAFVPGAAPFAGCPVCRISAWPRREICSSARSHPANRSSEPRKSSMPRRTNAPSPRWRATTRSSRTVKGRLTAAYCSLAMLRGAAVGSIVIGFLYLLMAFAQVTRHEVRRPAGTPTCASWRPCRVLSRCCRPGSRGGPPGRLGPGLPEYSFPGPGTNGLPLPQRGKRLAGTRHQAVERGYRRTGRTCTPPRTGPRRPMSRPGPTPEAQRKTPITCYIPLRNGGDPGAQSIQLCS
jgi:hypothetical protein